MIRVEREEKGKNGRYRYCVAGWAVEGVSRQPLLGACRDLKRMGVAPSREIGLFRGKSEVWDLRTAVGYGASKTIAEEDRDGLRLKDFVEVPQWKKREGII